MSVEESKIRVRFRHTEGGLEARDEWLKGFAVAGDDDLWQWAEAQVEGDSVLLWSPFVAAPRRVRYSWAAHPIGNLQNGAGWPAVPFRTDTHSIR